MVKLSQQQRIWKHMNQNKIAMKVASAYMEKQAFFGLFSPSKKMTDKEYISETEDLALSLYKGRKINPKFSNAIRILKEEASSGNAKAKGFLKMYNMGDMIAEGHLKIKNILKMMKRGFEDPRKGYEEAMALWKSCVELLLDVARITGDRTIHNDYKNFS